MLQVLPTTCRHSPSTVALSGCAAIGPIYTIHLEPGLRRAVQEQFQIEIEMASTFYRAMIQGKTYYSKSYTRAKTRNSYTVQYTDNGVQKFGFINYFLSVSSLCVAVVTPLTPTSSYCFPPVLSILCDRIIPVSVESSTVLVSTNCLSCMCVCISVGGAVSVARSPNQLYCE